MIPYYIQPFRIRMVPSLPFASSVGMGADVPNGALMYDGFTITFDGFTLTMN